MRQQRHYMKWPLRWQVVCPIRDGFLIKATAIQYDTTGSACVLLLTHDDGHRDVTDAAKAGRAYLEPVRVDVVGEYEPGLALIQSPQLRQNSLVFVPEELLRLGKDHPCRHVRAAV